MIAHIKDNKYWNEYYEKKQNAPEISNPSNFALFTQQILNSENKDKKYKILEIGCGNGRDAEHLALKNEVYACDLSEVSINKLKEKNTRVNYFVADFTRLEIKETFDVAYSRFSLHSVDDVSEYRTIKSIYDLIEDGGLFFVETRSNYDELCGQGQMISKNEWIFDGHYRRFNILEDFLRRVKEIGFVPEYVIQSNNLSPFGDRNPVVIRVILRK
jgi:SAM-dependent methyltransferase